MIAYRSQSRLEIWGLLIIGLNFGCEGAVPLLPHNQNLDLSNAKILAIASQF